MLPRLFRYSFLLFLFLVVFFPTRAHTFQKDADQKRGYNLVLIIDVSPSLRESQNIVKNIVTGIYDSIFHPPKDDLHIIVFSNYAEILDPGLKKAGVLKIVENELIKKRESTLPANGLRKVFDLMGEKFPDKISAIFFISDGENSGDKAKLKETQKLVGALKNNGFTLFSIFVSTKTQYSDKSFMARIADWSNTPLYEVEKTRDIKKVLKALKKDLSKTQYSSPISFEELEKLKNQWQEELHATYGQMNMTMQKEVEAVKSKWDNDLQKIQPSPNHYLGYLILILLAIAGTALYIIKVLKPNPIQNIIFSSEAPLWGILTPSKGHPKINLSEKFSGYTFPVNSKLRLQFVQTYVDNQKRIFVHGDKQAIQYLDSEKQTIPSRTINEATRFIRVMDEKSKPHEYEYHFIDQLWNIRKTPAQIQETFYGHTSLLDQMKSNFLQAPNKISHYMITGMGNAGKTHLLRYFYHVVFPSSRQLKNRFHLSLLEFGQCKEMTLDALKKMISPSQKEQIIILDEYDNFLDQFSAPLMNWLQNLHQDQKSYLIMTGRKGSCFLNQKQLLMLPSQIKEIIIKGLDDLTSLPTLFPNSIKFINQTLDSIGFNPGLLTEDVKNKIAEYAGGIPYLMKKILAAVIQQWINREQFSEFQMADLEKIIPEVMGPEKFNTIIKACNSDEQNLEFINHPSHTISFKNIFNSIAIEGKGRLSKAVLQETLLKNNTPCLHPDTGALLDTKLTKLKSMGFIVEENGYIMGIPRMFFYQGEYIL